MKKEKKTLDIETFGEIMDDLIKENHVQLLVDMPEGTNEPEIKDNIGLGGTVQFYILLAAMKPVFKNIHDHILDHDKTEDFVDAVLDIVKEDLMEVVAGQAEMPLPEQYREE